MQSRTKIPSALDGGQIKNNGQIQWSRRLCMMKQAAAFPQTVPLKLPQYIT